MTRPASVAHPEEVELWRSAAAAVEPREAVRPSEWAERSIMLSREQSHHRPGPYSCDWKPWLRALHDLCYDEPGKKGIIGLKPAQIGFTRFVLNLILCYCRTRPAPMAYVISDKNKAGGIAAEEIRPFFAGDPVQKHRRDVTTEIPFKGGRLDVAGAGSVSALTTKPYRVVVGDEYEIFMDNWPAIAAAQRHDVGVFIISPSDKGGHLYSPPQKLIDLCAPLSPMVFNDLFCLSHSQVHTLSLGAARPSDFDEHL